MIGLPNDGDLVTIWPMPGRRVQASERTLDTDGGGRLLAAEGHEVKWGPFYLKLLRAGDILLVKPPKPKNEEPKKVAAPKKHDPEAAAKAIIAADEAAAKQAAEDAEAAKKKAASEAKSSTTSKG